jgi:hypothetical protein
MKASPTIHGYDGYKADKIAGSSIAKQEHTVINIGDPDGVPRLV